MLLYPAMKDLLKNVPSRYLLVNLVAARARKISSLAEQEGLPLEEKPVTMAIQEVAEGILRPETAQIAGQDEGNEGPDAALEGDEQASE